MHTNVKIALGALAGFVAGILLASALAIGVQFASHAFGPARFSIRADGPEARVDRSRAAAPGCPMGEGAGAGITDTPACPPGGCPIAPDAQPSPRRPGADAPTY
ncbi:MAG: hypothetical protein Q7W30_10200 [Coriobacteriia bacterium]|nr:hypothetical protein [Coriobacteriia bacterium]